MSKQIAEAGQNIKINTAKAQKNPAKSIVVFEVKVYEQSTDLDLLANKILSLQIDGLVWNKQIKKKTVIQNIQKLQICCVVEDDKVMLDNVFEPIEEWEEVQSVDLVMMQKV